MALLREGPGIEHYEDVFAEVDQLGDGMAFLDFGANAGLFTLVASSRVGPNGVVFAFEPSIGVFKDLIDNIVENHCANVVPFNIALGGSDGLVKFDQGKPTHSGIAMISPQGNGLCAQVRFDGLFDAVMAICCDRNIVIKMDIEGAEVLALRSMNRLLASPQLCKAIIEVNEVQLSRFKTTPKELYDQFSAHGFSARVGMCHSGHYNEVFFRLQA